MRNSVTLTRSTTPGVCSHPASPPGRTSTTDDTQRSQTSPLRSPATPPCQRGHQRPLPALPGPRPPRREPGADRSAISSRRRLAHIGRCADLGSQGAVGGRSLRLTERRPNRQGAQSGVPHCSLDSRTSGDGRRPQDKFTGAQPTKPANQNDVTDTAGHHKPNGPNQKTSPRTRSIQPQSRRVPVRVRQRHAAARVIS